MRTFFGTLTAILFTTTAFAQTTISGSVKDADQKPLPDATVVLHEKNAKDNMVITNANGSFIFRNIQINSKATITASFTGKQTFSVVVDGSTANISIVLADDEAYLQPLEITSIRASDKMPLTKTNISKAGIDKINLGQDIPVLLNQTPSVTITSDAGNGVGYTGIRIRGSDATRTNVTLNGIPFNDAESLGSYFVDLPDFISSANSIQIQRGLGTSTNGSGAFGASVNISTNELNKDAYGETNNSYGSFNTWKNTVRAGSGLINNHFTIDARLSRIASDGYIDRASSNLQSFYLSGAYINNKTSLRFNIFSGEEKTYQAWYGIPIETLETDRKYNPAGTEKPGSPYDNQTDNYTQTHYQLFFNQTLNSKLKFSTALFLVKGKGYYEEYKAGETLADYGLANVTVGDTTITSTDLVRRLWLDNYYYGQLFSLQYKTLTDELTFGGSWSRYDGGHYGKLIWGQFGVPVNYKYYNLPANKTDANVYAKWLHGFTNRLNGFVDVQYRYVKHTMNGFEDNPDLAIKRTFNFFNPKAGLSYVYKDVNAYISYGLGHKEPNRDDFEASRQQQPKAETLHDFEAGISEVNSKYNWSLTTYYMLYKNQLVLTGEINDVGSYTRFNVPNSYRAGLEMQGGINISKWLQASANLTLSNNKIKSFTEYLDNYDGDFNYIDQKAFAHNNTNIAFSPAVIGGATISILPVQNLALNFISKYVGKQYLDNSSNPNRKLNAYFTEDFRLNYTIKKVVFKQIDFIAQVNNIFNKMYAPNGYTYPYYYDAQLVNENYYYPMAGINYMIGLNIKL